MKMKSVIYVFVMAITLLSSACVRSESKGGYVTEYSKYDQIKKGMTKKDVVEKIGSPSFSSTFDDKKWFYVGMKMEQTPFGNAETVKQDTITVAFDDKGLVLSVYKDSSAGGRNIKIAEDETPTEGNDMGVMEQLLGNLGRFNPGN